MATTARQVFNIAMDLIDERLDSGAISESDTKSYNVKTPGILTTGQYELMEVGDLYKTFEISNKPIPSMYGLLTGFEVVEFKGDELTYPINGSCKAYYFEADGPGTVYIEDYNGAWNTLATVTIGDITSFTAYKGIVTPSSGATQSRMRFAGDYYYRITNRALFSYPLQAERVPDYRPWVKKQMPDDFKSVDQIINEHPQRQYTKDTNYKWEGRRDLYFNYYYEGNIRVVYKPVPSRIETLDDVLQIDDITATTVLPFYLATILMLDENPNLASYFNGRFSELKTMATLPKPASEESIVDVYRAGRE
jgi:hypothetical protein